MEDQYRTYARYSFVQYLLEIAVDNYLHFLEFEEGLKIVEEKGKFEFEGGMVYNDLEGYFFYSSGSDKSRIQCVVFIEIFLEAYIYEFGAIALGDNYISKNLDNLRTYAKWLVIVKLITGSDLDESLAHHAKFKELIKFRNSLVHYKSQNAFSNGEIVINPKLDLKDIDLYSYFVMLKDLFDEVDKLDDRGFHGMMIKSHLRRVSIT